MGSNNTNTDAHMEQNISDGHLGEKGSPRFNSRVRITIYSARKRLADPDGISAKAAIDGLVKAGILEDDSAKFVEEVRYRQEKTKGEESTRIVVEEV